MKTDVGITSVLRRYFVGIVSVLALVACAEQVVAPEVGMLRNPTANLGGTARFTAESFAGDWQTIGCIGTCARSERYGVATDGVYLRQVGEAQTPYTISAPGVLRQMGGEDTLEDTLVVMWVDEGFRTAAIGDADGRWAAVISRKRGGGADRLKAATEILDFNGWDTSKLRAIE